MGSAKVKLQNTAKRSSCDQSKRRMAGKVSWQKETESTEVQDMCYLLSEHTANPLEFEHPVLWKLGELGYLPNLICMSFGELCFFLRFWFQTKWALDATCLGGTGAAARALLGTGFLSSLQLSLLMVLSYRNLSNCLIQGSHQNPNPEKITPNPTLFGVCYLLEGGKNILGLLRCA